MRFPCKRKSSAHRKVRTKHFNTFRENLRIFTEEEKDCGLLKISQFSGRNPDQTNCFSAACALEKPAATYTPLRLIHLDVLRNLF